jgi:hypothetical protein
MTLGLVFHEMWNMGGKGEDVVGREGEERGENTVCHDYMQLML